MIEAFIRGMLGSWGSRLLDLILSHPVIVSGILAAWLGLYLAGRLQLAHIERQTIEMVTRLSREMIARKPHITSRGLYRRIYPRWKEAVREWGWFIPHRFDLWPVPVRPETVEQKMPFSAQWIAETLTKHGIQLEQSNNDRQSA